MLLLVVALLSIFAVSCVGNSYVDMRPVSPYSWSEPVSILYQNSDTTALRDIAVAVRYNKNFDADTLSVVVQTSLPDAHQFSEQVMLQFKQDYTAAAVTASEAVLYRSGCQLGQSGYYIFTITPTRAVKGVEAVGIAFTNLEDRP